VLSCGSQTGTGIIRNAVLVLLWRWQNSWRTGDSQRSPRRQDSIGQGMWLWQSSQ